MPEAKLTLDLPETTWVGDLTRRHPELRVSVLAAVADDGGTGLAEIAGPGLGSFLSELEDHPVIDDVAYLERSDERALVQFRTSMPLLISAAQDSGLPLEMPFEIVDGEATWQLTVSQSALSELGDRLDALGVDYTVEYIQQEIGGAEQLLTDRQRQLVDEAVTRGYYETPRRCTLTELAEAVGIAKSTCSETLHRAEGRIVSHFHESVLARD